MAAFAEEFNRLALAVSVINKENWDGICNDLNTYFSDIVGACYWEISIAGTRVQNEPGLKTIITSEGIEDVYSLSLDEKKAYKDFRSYAYAKGRPLWIVDKGGKMLKGGDLTLVDKWSDADSDEEFPKKFPDNYDHPAKTALFNLLNFQGNNFGVFVLEHEDVKLLTPEVKEEIQLVNDSLSRIVRVWQTTKEQIEAVTEARGKFHRFVNSFSSIADPKKIFVASPKNRDEGVWGAIDSVLKKKKYKDRFQVIRWDEKTQPGNIFDSIIKDAMESSIGVCLFSEKLIEGKTSKNGKEMVAPDNPNVVYEAGVIQALVDSPDRHCKALVPIREEERIAGRPFFDISHDRLCIINRDKRNKFLEDDFKKQFEDMIDTALNSPA